MWHNAILSGYSGKKFPPLEQFLTGTKKQVKGIDEDAIMARLKAYSERQKQDA